MSLLSRLSTNFRVFTFLFSVLLSAPFFVSAACAQHNPGVIAFQDVNVLPMDRDVVLSGQTVVVRDGRIYTVGGASEVTIPDDATVVDGAGRYLVPGLAEMHGHIPSGNADAQYVEDILFMFIANGITTVRGMQGGAGQLELAARVASGEIPGPTLYLAGPAFSGGSVDSPEQAEERVRAQKAEGWHLLKVLPGLTREEYDAMARTANALNIPFAGHVPADVGLIHALEMGQSTFDHVDGFLEHLDAFDNAINDASLADVIARTREADAAIVPTMAVWEVLLGALEAETVEGYSELQYLPPSVRDQWINSHRNRMSNPDLNRERARQIVEKRQRVLRELNEAGVTILMGMDAPQQFSVPGFSLHHEIERMVDAGMTPYQILRSGSFWIGRHFAGEDAFGTVVPGMRADLILLDQNPLEGLDALKTPAGVMANGRWYDRATLNRGLASIAERYASN